MTSGAGDELDLAAVAERALKRCRPRYGAATFRVAMVEDLVAQVQRLCVERDQWKRRYYDLANERDVLADIGATEQEAAER